MVTWGFKSGDVIHLPETGKVITIEQNGDTTMCQWVVFLGAIEATHDVAEVEYIKSPLVTALAIFMIAALIFWLTAHYRYFNLHVVGYFVCTIFFKRILY